MKSLIVGAVLVSTLGACAMVDYEKYEGQQLVREGTGGTKSTVDGIDVWSYGAPPRRYEILGVVTVSVPSGPVAQHRITSNAAEKAKEMGGSAAINIDTLDTGTMTSVASAFGSNGSYATGTSMSIGNAKGRYLVIKYLN
ncbi:hypothetical protein [Cupriavidus sp. D384]|uniref:hypothetical protein n=1 Tax=Cupriavidus sp. D384 TaxID=1538095 RepID=UPI000832A86E|nr:hypothetical protein [Cupriavidus sp. D384]